MVNQLAKCEINDITDITYFMTICGSDSAFKAHEELITLHSL